jgi:hypothetical protein
MPVEGRKFLPVSITRIHSHNQNSDRNINDRLIKRKSNKISDSITKKKKIIIRGMLKTNNSLSPGMKAIFVGF